MARERILVVDDNLENLNLACSVLASKGYVADAALNATLAMEVLRKVRPRLILMDLQLPDVDGLELTRRLKADPATRDIVILALTAQANKAVEAQARDAGCDGFLAKPFDVPELPKIVAAYLKRTPKPQSRKKRKK